MMKRIINLVKYRSEIGSYFEIINSPRSLKNSPMSRLDIPRKFWNIQDIFKE